MILPKLYLPPRTYAWTKKFGNIQYIFNSRGFRDAEWPDTTEELREAIWCVGDSNTIGVASALHNTWPHMLQSATGRRCINISMGGASNVWMARQICYILDQLSPTNLVVHWTYLHRTENPDPSLPDHERRTQFIDDISTPAQLSHFSNSINSVNAADKHSSIIHSFIPNAIPDYDTHALDDDWHNIRGADWPLDRPQSLYEFENLPEFIKQELNIYQRSQAFIDAINIRIQVEKIMVKPFLPPPLQVDTALDNTHYGTKTAANFVAAVSKLIK
jgi:hypothetical protein